MMFAEKIRQLRYERQIPQRQLAAALEIDTATYCKIEHGYRRAKREQVVFLSKLLETSQEKLLTLWLADQITEVVGDDKKIAKDSLKIVNRNL